MTLTAVVDDPPFALVFECSVVETLVLQRAVNYKTTQKTTHRYDTYRHR